ncbi:DNA adenine methylase [Agrobacterium tumefaciens]|uniref:DNA adenine methylase n=1 Tax=Agrobacterium tumefaciens TaxID=358 RepID=UPI001F1D4D93|nr:DNA adenine methylase [Agrobacterium tumefaciens]WCK73164.1 DNA adenine methylase [Agrobacterium tumefaciens]
MRWHGGKWRIAPWVIDHFPPHKVYVEPFGGAASVLLQKPRALSEIYNDLDQDLVRMFRIIRDQSDELTRAIALTPYARDEYRGLYEPVDDELEATRRFIVRSFMGMNSKGALAKSGFDARINPDSFTSRLRSLADLPDQVALVAGRFLHVLIENCDAKQLITRYDRDDALIYLDPPYVSETRSGKYYTHEMTDADHSALLAAIDASSAMVVISGYPSDLYDKAMIGWHRVETKAHTDGAKARIEVLWINPKAWSRIERNQSSLFNLLAGNVA